MRRLTAVCLVTALALAGCAVGGFTPREQYLSACEAYSGALDTLAAYRADGELTKTQLDAVNASRRVVNPLCQAGFSDLSDPQKALELIERELVQMQGIKKDAQGGTDAD